MPTFTFDNASLVPFFSDAAGLFTPDSKGYAGVGYQDIEAICENLVAEFEDSGYVLRLAGPVLAIQQLLEAATSLDGAAAVDNSSVLTLFVEPETGEVTKVFGPALFANDGKVVIRFGKNFIPVTTQGDRVTVGDYTGRVDFESGESSEGVYLKGALSLKVSHVDGEVSEFVIPAIFPRGTDLSPRDIKDSLESGSTLADFLQSAQGGGKYVRLADLEVGAEYEIAGIDGSGNPAYGQYRIELVDGRIVSLNQALKVKVEGLASAGLEIASRHFAGKYLRILKKDFKGGKNYVTAQVINLQPVAMGAARVAAELPAATPKQLPAAEAPKPVSFAENRLAAMRAKVQAKTPVAADPLTDKYDAIPF